MLPIENMWLLTWILQFLPYFPNIYIDEYNSKVIPKKFISVSFKKEPMI